MGKVLSVKLSEHCICVISDLLITNSMGENLWTDFVAKFQTV